MVQAVGRRPRIAHERRGGGWAEPAPVTAPVTVRRDTGGYPSDNDGA